MDVDEKTAGPASPAEKRVTYAPVVTAATLFPCRPLSEEDRARLRAAWAPLRIMPFRRR